MKFVLLMLALLAAPLHYAAAQAPALLTEERRGDLEVLLGTIQDDAKRAEFVKELRGALDRQKQEEAESGGLVGSIADSLSVWLSHTGEAFASLGQALSEVPDLVGRIVASFDNPVVQKNTALVFGLFVVIFLAAFIVERLVVRPLQRRVAPYRSTSGTASWSARVPPLTLNFLLDVIPPAVLIGVAWLTLPMLELGARARLALLSLVAAAAVTGGVMAVARLLLAPGRDDLRLFPLTGETAGYLTVWVRRFAIALIFGYCLIEALRLLGLDRAAHLALLRLLGIVLAALAILFVLQNRTPVRQWLQRSSADRVTAAGRQFRARLGDIWHVLAIVYIVACLFVWSTDIRGGINDLVRATFATGLVFVLSGFASRAVDFVVGRAFRVSGELRETYPGLETRANRYLPVLRRLLSFIIVTGTLLAILQVWGIGVVAWLTVGSGQHLVRGLLTIALVLFGALVLWDMANAWIERYLNEVGHDGRRMERTARARTLLPLLRNALTVVLVVICGLIALSELGINIAPLLAGAGVVGLAIGFGSQKLVQDVITGFFLLVEDAISVGDVVAVGAHSGQVEGLTIRSLKLRDGNGTLHTIPFSSVDRLSIMTRDFSFAVFDINVSYASDVDQVIDVLRELGEGMQNDPVFGPQILAPIEIMGLDQFGESGLLIKSRMKTRPIQQWGVAREFNRRLKKRFDEMGIEIPFRNVTVHVTGSEGAPAPVVQAAAQAGAAAALDNKP
jgi:small conductance mechanosensitive channel